MILKLSEENVVVNGISSFLKFPNVFVDMLTLQCLWGGRSLRATAIRNLGRPANHNRRSCGQFLVPRKDRAVADWLRRNPAELSAHRREKVDVSFRRCSTVAKQPSPWHEKQANKFS